MYKDLLDQAVRLAQLDAKKPKQANLRRAISDEKRFFLACLWAWKELANR